ncbi:GNAT family N-acetyltransferase [Actinokineospora sp. G85]|uniref:GNAT family N-acetyltransferase n=1 Tax=Actinokineospora sp. G85 TaxID=3406626 RepID=UPI003C79482C
MDDVRTTQSDGVAKQAMSIDVLSGLTDQEWTALRDLRDAVYPPEEEGAWAGGGMEWAPAHWRVGVWAPDGVLACHVGMQLRTGTYNGDEVKIGGVGGVKTHPRYRGRGYAEDAMRSAAEFFHRCGDVDFGLLVCDPPLVDYYTRVGWREFTGRLFMTQFDKHTEFTYSRIMTLPVVGKAPTDGDIDLGGPPW